MAAKSRFQRLFQPGRIGEMELRNRIVMPAMGTSLATEDGYVTEQLKDHYEERAKGGVGLVIVESTCVDFPIGKNIPIPPVIDDDKFIPGLSELAQAIKRQGAKAAIQFQHAGASSVAQIQHVAPSAIVMPGYEPPRELTVSEIQDIVTHFAKAAERAERAGFDAIELHAAHGYLFAQFLSPIRNKRQDDYGGNLSNRARFLLEVITAIRETIGEKLPLWCRMNAGEYRVERGRIYEVEEGFTLEEAQEVAQMAQAAGVDAINVSSGGGEGATAVRVGIPTSPGPMIPLAEAIKRVVDVPVIAVGMITPQLGERVLREGKADFIAMGRALIADPELPNKVASGRLDEIVPCMACYTCIERIWVRGEPLRCGVNTASGREREYRIEPAKEAKNILVVGGGPAGMEAARVAALRGHKVTLYERGRRLGGSAIAASSLPLKGEIAKLTKYLARQVSKVGIKIVLGAKVTPALIEEAKPDVVIIATGGSPLIPEIPGIDKHNVVSTEDVKDMLAGHLNRGGILLRLGSILLGRSSLPMMKRIMGLGIPLVFGKRVIILGGGMPACQLADLLAEKGRKVTIVAMEEELATEMATMLRWALLDSLMEKRTTILTGVRSYEKITDQGLVIIDNEGKRQTIQADTIMPVMGLRSDIDLFQALEDKVSEIYRVGDCAEPRMIFEAIHDGSSVGRAV